MLVIALESVNWCIHLVFLKLHSHWWWKSCNLIWFCSTWNLPGQWKYFSGQVNSSSGQKIMCHGVCWSLVSPHHGGQGFTKRLPRFLTFKSLRLLSVFISSSDSKRQNQYGEYQHLLQRVDLDDGHLKQYFRLSMTQFGALDLETNHDDNRGLGEMAL